MYRCILQPERNPVFMAHGIIPEFLKIPYLLAQKIGLEKALLLERLRQWQKVAEARDWNKDEQGRCWHWHTREMLSQETLLSEKQIRSYLAEFQEIGVVKWEQKAGFDRKSYFYVNLTHSYCTLEEPPSFPEGNIDPSLRATCMLTKRQHGRCPEGKMGSNLREEIKEEINVPASLSLAGPVEEKPKKDPKPKEEKKTKEPIEGKPKRKPPADGTEVWKAYLEAYGQRFRDPTGKPIAPPSNMRSRTVCARLVSQYGKDVAISLAHFLFTSKDAYIVRNSYSILGITDAVWSGLYTQMMSGQRMTQAKAQLADKNGTNASVAETVAARMKAKFAAVGESVDE